MAAKILRRQLGNVDTNPIEQQINQGVSAVKQAAKDEAQAEINTLWKQLLGSTREMVKEDVQKPVNEGPVKAGDLSEGEELVLIGAKKEKKEGFEPGIDYVREIIHAETIHNQKDSRELRQRVEEIQIELRKLSKSSKELEVTFKNVSVETINMPANPGKYHLNFFEWMLATIQNARMRIEDSASWLNVVSGKKSRKDYWNLAKKHGTSFSLSGERVVATQVG